ncbi:glycosyltransferase [Methylococcus capsulatus]|uniref:Glycosyl transferase, group 1 family protein n=1 Tax=Methylococcus capsulatus (strain ATCC 33009 / NCIMB 11132 / Bath) TaxID=243233 RepID=Q609R9_METCA|nr:glycosyltransferase family 4 protein [Methylococcus capsulatus]AAU92792.1 glycosyl transferase, group 1 family protein [Methylococcus capsulatus str. Bath]QXP94878.1 glycosyltransferase family 4 protein [Methylococcus capsulatus]
MAELAFAWPGLPDYAARCIRATIDRCGVPVSVIGTRPGVPIEGMEASLGQAIHWIHGEDGSLTWEKLGLAPPAVLIQGGYHLPAINALGRQCRAAGGKVVLASDQNWTGNMRQRFVDPLLVRKRIKTRFDALFIPGASAQRYYRHMFYPVERTVTGLYGSDPTLFNGGAPLMERPKTFLFVGQFIPRKNVVGLARAFIRFVVDHPDWTLRLCGSGEQRGEIPDHPQILIENFVQPPQLAEMLRKARCLVLPSIEEHWGLVVHEAALTGCALALTNVVGAGDDLARPQNAVLFPPRDEAAIERTLREIAAWDIPRWQTAERISRDLARGFGPTRFADAVDDLVHRLA